MSCQAGHLRKVPAVLLCSPQGSLALQLLVREWQLPSRYSSPGKAHF